MPPLPPLLGGSRGGVLLGSKVWKWCHQGENLQLVLKSTASPLVTGGQEHRHTHAWRVFVALFISWRVHRSSRWSQKILTIQRGGEVWRSRRINDWLQVGAPCWPIVVHVRRVVLGTILVEEHKGSWHFPLLSIHPRLNTIFLDLMLEMGSRWRRRGWQLSW
jgi:hypothetical protein